MNQPKAPLSSLLVALANGDEKAQQQVKAKQKTARNSNQGSAAPQKPADPWDRVGVAPSSMPASPLAPSSPVINTGPAGAPAYAAALFGNYTPRSADRLSVPIKAQNVVMEHPEAFAPLPKWQDNAAAAAATESGSSGEMKRGNSAQVLGARVVSTQPINSAQGGNVDTGMDDSKLMSMLLPNRLITQINTYENSHTYEKSSRNQREHELVTNMEEAKKAQAAGEAYLGQSARALLHAQSTPRMVPDMEVEVTEVQAIPAFGVSQVILGASSRKKQEEKERKQAIPPHERLLSGSARLLLDYFTPFLQPQDVAVTDVRVQLERIPFMAVNPNGGIIIAVLCEAGYNELAEYPRLLLSYVEQLQRFRQRLTEIITQYLHLHLYQAMTLYDGITGFICLERLNAEQVRKLVQNCRYHRIVKERRELMALFTEQIEQIRLMCPIDGMYQYCHNFLRQNFHFQPYVPEQDPTKADKPAATSQMAGLLASAYTGSGAETLAAQDLAAAFSTFLQEQLDEPQSKYGRDPHEALAKLQEYLQESDLVGAKQQVQTPEVNSGEVWLGNCQQLRTLQERGFAPHIFLRTKQVASAQQQGNEQQPARNTLNPTQALEWDKIVTLSRYLNHSYQPMRASIRLFVPNPSLLQHQSMVPVAAAPAATGATAPNAALGASPAAALAAAASAPRPNRAPQQGSAPIAVRNAAQVQSMAPTKPLPQRQQRYMQQLRPQGQQHAAAGSGARRPQQHVQHGVPHGAQPLRAQGSVQAGGRGAFAHPQGQMRGHASHGNPAVAVAAQGRRAPSVGAPMQNAAVGNTAAASATALVRAGQRGAPAPSQAAMANQPRRANVPASGYPNMSRGNGAPAAVPNAASNTVAQAFGASGQSLMQQKARYQEAVMLGQQVAAPLMAPLAANQAGDVSMNFSLRGGRGNDFGSAGQQAAPMKSVTVANVNVQQDGTSNNAQMQWQGSLPLAVSTMNMQGQSLMLSSFQQQQPKAAAPSAAQSNQVEESVDDLVAAAMQADPEYVAALAKQQAEKEAKAKAEAAAKAAARAAALAAQAEAAQKEAQAAAAAANPHRAAYPQQRGAAPQQNQEPRAQQVPAAGQRAAPANAEAQAQAAANAQQQQQEPETKTSGMSLKAPVRRRRR